MNPEAIKFRLSEVRKLYRQKKYKEALGILDEVFKDHPDHKEALEGRSLIQKAMEREGLASPAEPVSDESYNDLLLQKSAASKAYETSERPFPITIFGWFGIVMGVIALFLMFGMGSLFLAAGVAGQPQAAAIGFMVLALPIALICINIVCYWNLLEGKKWAYYLFMVLCCWSFLNLLLGRHETFINKLDAVISGIFAVYLLASPKAKAFFGFQSS